MRKSARHPERGSRASKSIHSTSVTVTLFAALEVATGKVATHKKRRRRVEFLAFMNEVTAAYPDLCIRLERLVGGCGAGCWDRIAIRCPHEVLRVPTQRHTATPTRCTPCANPTTRKAGQPRTPAPNPWNGPVSHA